MLFLDKEPLIAYFPWCSANLTNVDSGRYYKLIYAAGDNYLQIRLELGWSFNKFIQFSYLAPGNDFSLSFKKKNVNNCS